MSDLKKRRRTFKVWSERVGKNSPYYVVYQNGSDGFGWDYVEYGEVVAQSDYYATYGQALNALYEDIEECWKDSLYYVPLRDKVWSAVRGARKRGV